MNLKLFLYLLILTAALALTAAFASISAHADDTVIAARHDLAECEAIEAWRISGENWNGYCTALFLKDIRDILRERK